MGERRNPHCQVEFVQSPSDKVLARTLGINLQDAMLCALARIEPSIGDCEHIRFAVIARDEATYDWIVAQGSKLKLPVPQEMIDEAISHSLETGKLPQLNGPKDARAIALSSGSFSACCSKSKDVSVILAGTVTVTPPGLPSREEIRYAVGSGMSVFATEDPVATGPLGKKLIKKIEVNYNEINPPCPPKP